MELETKGEVVILKVFNPAFFMDQSTEIESVTESVMEKYDDDSKYALQYKRCFRCNFREPELKSLVMEHINASTTDESERKFIYNRIWKYPENDLEGEFKTLKLLKDTIDLEKSNYSSMSKSISKEKFRS